MRLGTKMEVPWKYVGRVRGTQLPGGGDIELGLRIRQTLLDGEGAEKGKMYHRDTKWNMEKF